MSDEKVLGIRGTIGNDQRRYCNGSMAFASNIHKMGGFWTMAA
jgi:hypothetical protein